MEKEHWQAWLSQTHDLLRKYPNISLQKNLMGELSSFVFPCKDVICLSLLVLN